MAKWFLGKLDRVNHQGRKVWPMNHGSVHHAVSGLFGVRRTGREVSRRACLGRVRLGELEEECRKIETERRRR